MRIVILHSAIAENAGPDEQDTLVQVNAIYRALEKLGNKVISLPFILDFSTLSSALQKYQPTLVFNLVESVLGRTELIHLPPLYLEQLNIPYTGSNANALFLSSDKCLSKRLLQAENITTPEWLETETVFPANGPYLVKSVLEDGSLGLDRDSLVYDQQQLIKIIHDRRQRFGGKWFAERYIAGREFNIALLAGPQGPEVLPIAEIQFANLPLPIVDYAAKWYPDSVEYQATTSCFNFNEQDKLLFKKLIELSLHCWKVFKFSGYARVDVRVDQNGQPWVLEVNANPCLSPDAGFIAAAEQAGLDYNDVVKRI